MDAGAPRTLMATPFPLEMEGVLFLTESLVAKEMIQKCGTTVPRVFMCGDSESAVPKTRTQQACFRINPQERIHKLCTWHTGARLWIIAHACLKSEVISSISTCCTFLKGVCHPKPSYLIEIQLPQYYSFGNTIWQQTLTPESCYGSSSNSQSWALYY